MTDQVEDYQAFLEDGVRRLGRAGTEEFIEWFGAVAPANGEDPAMVAEVIADLRRTIEELPA